MGAQSNKGSSTSEELRSVKELRTMIRSCMRRDQHRLRRQLSQFPASKDLIDNSATGYQKWRHQLSQSMALRERRFSSLPKPLYPDTLPVVSMREEIIDTIIKHQVVIVCGETGSGKTTQLPKMCLEAGLGVSGYIGHTQPRRLAARSVASRIAEELETTVGEGVGFKIRFTDQVSEQSHIKLMTDGILLAEIQADPFLNQYDAIIVDEAHERSLNIDFLLGCLKRLLPKRPELKVIITSATIDPESFSRYFDKAPVILAEGRSYPVEVRYLPPSIMAAGHHRDETDDDSVDDDNDDDDIDLNLAVSLACEDLIKEQHADILVFLSGEREIRELADVLAKQSRVSRILRQAEVLPLFARLSNADQNKIFQKHSHARIILATNVAETSLTVPGIRSVIDVGYARISRYSVRGKMQRLPVERVSRASADQRKGRCGREAPGVCIRLYDEEDYLSRPEFTEPEILRTNLASVILQMASMRLGAIENFPLIERPQPKLVNDGYRTLQELSALDGKRKLLPLGRRLARFPVDPRLARMLLAAQDEGCVDEVLTVVSALAVQDPRDRPFDKRQQADELHAEFRDEHSDFLAWVNLWKFVTVQRKELSGSRFRKMCRQRFLSPVRLFEWIEVRRQLAVVCRSMKIRPNTTEAPYDQVHRALLSGLLINVAVKTDKHDYLGTRNRRLQIFPGSGLFKSGPKWLMAAEISETNRVYARQVARIDPVWLEKLAAHILQYSYRDPHWQRKTGHVGAYRQSTLFGLIVNNAQRVNYAPINPSESREIFIRDALVPGQLRTRGKFLHHNLELLDEIEGLEDKSRRRDIVVDALEMVRFYEKLLPEQVNSTSSFESWRKDFEVDAPRGLYFTREMLLLDDTETISEQEFPEQMEFEGVVVPLSYRFAPGELDDGVSLRVPVELLNRIDRRRCEWLVPGMLEEKIVLLLKGLPKQLRRNFVPVPDYAKSCLEAFAKRDQHLQSGLLEAMVGELFELTTVKLNVQDFDPGALPDHMRMRFSVMDTDGKVLKEGRDLDLLQKEFSGRVEEHLVQFSDSSIEQADVEDWNFGDLPVSVEIEKNGVTMQGYPALQVVEDRIAIKLFSSSLTAEQAMSKGMTALYKRVMSEEIKYLSRKLPNIDMLSLRFTPFGSKNQLIGDIINASVEHVLVLDRDVPRSREAFLQPLQSGRDQVVPTAGKICETLSDVMEHYRQVSRRLDGSLPLSWVEAASDIQDQIAGLLYVGFVSATGVARLARFAVYFQGMMRRLDGIDLAPDKDRIRRAELLPLWDQFKQLPATLENVPGYADDYLALRWSFEELRISLFAQELGTSEKISIPRIEKRLQQLQKLV